MKVSPELIGRVVSIQVAAPLYMIDYAAHLKYADGRQMLAGDVAMTKEGKEGSPVAMNVFSTAEVVAVTDDSVTVALLLPSRALVHKTIPERIIMSIDEVKAFEVSDEDGPQATVYRHQQASPLIKL
jgi:hypothetical protein